MSQLLPRPPVWMTNTCRTSYRGSQYDKHVSQLLPRLPVWQTRAPALTEAPSRTNPCPSSYRDSKYDEHVCQLLPRLLVWQTHVPALTEAPSVTNTSCPRSHRGSQCDEHVVSQILPRLPVWRTRAERSPRTVARRIDCAATGPESTRPLRIHDIPICQDHGLHDTYKHTYTWSRYV